MNEEEEVEYYEEDPRVYVCTTRSGRKVYSVPRLIVPIPNNDEDLAELETYDETYGSDCEEDLSERSGGEEEGGVGIRTTRRGRGGTTRRQRTRHRPRRRRRRTVRRRRMRVRRRRRT